MLSIVDIYLVKYAEEKLEDGLYTEGGHLDRVQIDPADGVAWARSSCTIADRRTIRTSRP